MSILEKIPGPSKRRIAIQVKPSAERALRQGHPWLFDQSIRRQSHAGLAGDLAVIFDRKDRFLAIGIYDPYSPIRVRVLQHNRPASIDQAWFYERLQEATASRESIPGTRTNAYRLVHGENDRLPGLVIDKYESNYVVKLYSHGWIPHLQSVANALGRVAQVERIVLRLGRSLVDETDRFFKLVDGQILEGSKLEGPVGFIENGLRFEADLIHGQKTGFFLDQRENRARVEKMVANDEGLLKVLNVFAYTGAFSLYAARGGARRVVSLDASKPALKAARRNFELNQDHPSVAATRHEVVVGDAFERMSRFIQTEQLFDMVIIDPPSFARRRTEVSKALTAYSNLVKSGLALLRPGGYLVMASCSSRVDAETFYTCLKQGAQEAGRQLLEVVRTGHPVDHPIGFPQGEYLKCLFAKAP